MTGDVSLTVVVATLGRADVDRTVRDVCASAEASGTSVEVVVAWQGAEPPPTRTDPVRMLDVYPVGLSYARNRGLAVASSPLVAFVDDDEAVDAGWVAGLLAAFDAEPDVAGVFGAVQPLDTDGIPYCEVTGEAPRVFRRASTPPWIVGTGGNMAFRRDALAAMGGFDIALGAGAPGRAGEEHDVTVRLLRSGTPVAFTPNAVVFHPSKTAAEHLASRRPYGHGAGAVARRRRDGGMAARYGVAIVQSFGTGVRSRDRQRRREAVRTGAGFASGLLRPPRGDSPLVGLERMPAEIRTRLGAASIRPERARYDGQPEFRYRAGPHRLRVRPGAERAAVPADAIVHRDAAWIVES